MPVDPITIPFRQLDTDSSGRLSQAEVDVLKQDFITAKQNVADADAAKLQQAEEALTAANQNNNDKIEDIDGLDEVNELIKQLKQRNLNVAADTIQDMYYTLAFNNPDERFGPGRVYSIDVLREIISKTAVVLDNRTTVLRDTAPEAINVYDELIGKTVGNYEIAPSNFVVEFRERYGMGTRVTGEYRHPFPGVKITASSEEKDLYKRFALAAGDDDIITKGDELVAFLNTYTNGAARLDSTQLNILYNETGLRFKNARRSYVKSFNPANVASPSFNINWPTGNKLANGTEEKKPKTTWTYGEMFRYWFDNKNKSSSSGEVT